MSTTSTPTQTGRLLLEAIRTGALPPPPAAELLGIELEAVENGETVFAFDAIADYGNPGSVHGGILAAIADFAVTTAIWTQVSADADIVTADLHVTYLRGLPLDGARYTCTGRLLHLGRTQANAAATIVAADGTEHVHALATCRIRTARQP